MRGCLFTLLFASFLFDFLRSTSLTWLQYYIHCQILYCLWSRSTRTAGIAATRIQFSSETVQTDFDSSIQEAGTAKLTELTSLFLQKSRMSDDALFADSNTDSFVLFIALCEKDWCPSQGQQEALLAEVALVVDGLVADGAEVGVGMVSVHSSGSQSTFLV